MSGSGAAIEVGTDAAAAAGRVLVQGDGTATEAPDVAQGQGLVFWPPVVGVGAATEAQDTVDGWAEPGHVEPGWVKGVMGSVGTTFAITGQQAMLIRKLHQLHGLAEPLVVSGTTRSAGDLVQSVSGTDTVRINTVGGTDTLTGSIGTMIEELAALHGLTTELVVTPTSRTAGSITQALAVAGTTTTVTRQ